MNVTTLTQSRAQLGSKHSNISLIKAALQGPVSIEIPSAAVFTHWTQTHTSQRWDTRKTMSQQADWPDLEASFSQIKL